MDIIISTLCIVLLFTGCNTSSTIDVLKDLDKVAVDHMEFDTNVTGPLTGKVYNLHKEKDKHIDVNLH